MDLDQSPDASVVRRAYRLNSLHLLCPGTLVRLRARLVAEMGEVEFAAEEAFGASLGEDGVYAAALEELVLVD